MTDTLTSLEQVLGEIAAERAAQDVKWGQQNHPVLFHSKSRPAYKTGAEAWKIINAERVGKRNAEGAPSDRNAGWDGIVLEEVYEAFAEQDPTRIRQEAVQAAATLVAMIECIDRNYLGVTL